MENDATWSEVCQTCCIHTPQEWGLIAIGIIAVCFFLYFFLVGLDLMGSAAKVLGGCTAGSLFGDQTNPVADLMIGILATFLPIILFNYIYRCVTCWCWINHSQGCNLHGHGSKYWNFSY